MAGVIVEAADQGVTVGLWTSAPRRGPGSRRPDRALAGAGSLEQIALCGGCGSPVPGERITRYGQASVTRSGSRCGQPDVAAASAVVPARLWPRYFARRGGASPGRFAFPVIRWRTVSYNNMPAATETFRLSTAPSCGSRTIQSHVCRVR